MRQTVLSLCAGTLLASLMMIAPLNAQTAGQRTNEQIQAAFNAHKADFDYLLGDWEFTGVRHQPTGELKFRGSWSAARLGEGQILDEYRVVDDKGATAYLSVTLRAYNAVLDQWDLVSSEAGTGLQNVGTGYRESAEVRIEQKFGVMSPNPSLWRIRYHGIQPDRFSWTADRSTDGGKTWVANFQQIEARRIGPPRSLGPLTSEKKPN